ncbi:MAG: hypothetical protein M0Z64_08145 [Nitrospiraceae bacterium]|nr:hypothetical protein [Nitrospiraceae bacterium]
MEAQKCPEGLYKELAEIDENLIRVELHYIDRGLHLKRRDEILMELGLRTQSGTNLKNLSGGTGEENSPVKTTSRIAKESGISERVAQQEKQVKIKMMRQVRQILIFVGRQSSHSV